MGVQSRAIFFFNFIFAQLDEESTKEHASKTKHAVEGMGRDFPAIGQ